MTAPRHAKLDSTEFDDPDDLLAKAAHHAYHRATKDWIMIPSWESENCLKEGWRAAAAAVLEVEATTQYSSASDL